MPPIKTDTKVVRLPMAPAVDLNRRITDECEQQSSRDEARRLVAAFAANNQLVLIFQVSPN